MAEPLPLPDGEISLLDNGPHDTEVLGISLRKLNGVSRRSLTRNHALAHWAGSPSVCPDGILGIGNIGVSHGLIEMCVNQKHKHHLALARERYQAPSCPVHALCDGGGTPSMRYAALQPKPCRCRFLFGEPAGAILDLSGMEVGLVSTSAARW
ncbi:hypothetical protein NM208_g15677 [Fusarium decemcellulare]|uniref:Uncharacterized protein n=1 Tax=Fusarium decemcellulare TaxID=57161 RepID=A0ACC1RCC9_9HYPO|nr:hypothetical protein NM208_g15677 [Fusarium decemcellulare]